jgi:hypothetical protein
VRPASARLLALLAALLGGGEILGPASATAQLVLDVEEELPFDAPESWAMKYYASVLLPTGMGAPEGRPAGGIEIAVEGVQVPQLSEEERRVGFDGTKVEDLNRTELFGRPLVLFALPRDWSLELSYLPSVELSGVESEVGSLAVARPIWRGGKSRLGLRAAGQYGTFEGDFTCSADEIAHGDNPYDCEAPSHDRQTARTFSLELAAAIRLGDGERWEAHGALIGTHMNLDFAVDARYAGLLDRTRLHTDGETLALAGGLGYHLAERWRAALELVWSPLDVVRPPATSSESDDLLHLRFALSYRARQRVRARRTAPRGPPPSRAPGRRRRASARAAADLGPPGRHG